MTVCPAEVLVYLTVLPLAVAVNVVMVGIEPEKVNTALEPWVNVVTVGWAPEKVNPVEGAMTYPECADERWGPSLFGFWCGRKGRYFQPKEL